MTTGSATAFDACAESYDDALQLGLSLSGEGPAHFARGRTRWLAERLDALAAHDSHGARADAVLDFGCGTGNAVPFLRDELRARDVIGTDPSVRSLELARAAHGGAAEFVPLDSFHPAGDRDLVYTSGVFHHIPPAERPAALAVIRRSLRPGGLLAFWENNPWNPGTRWVMSRIPFDHDAQTIAAPAARSLLRRAGFTPLRTDFLFIFPRTLRCLRPLERPLARWPIGAQYMVLARVDSSAG